jgi:hypothetical protein
MNRNSHTNPSIMGVEKRGVDFSSPLVVFLIRHLRFGSLSHVGHVPWASLFYYENNIGERVLFNDILSHKTEIKNLWR